MKNNNDTNFKDLDLDILFEELNNKKKQTENKKYNPQEQKDKTRSTIAKIFVWGYFLLLGAVFLLILINNDLVAFTVKNMNLILNPKDVLLVITSAVGTPLGFVVGYYFKGNEEKYSN